VDVNLNSGLIAPNLMPDAPANGEDDLSVSHDGADSPDITFVERQIDDLRFFPQRSLSSK
jgi:hypothetical protein